MRYVIFFLTVALAPSISSAQFFEGTNLYVWDFADRAGDQNDLTDKFTREFEEVLVNNGCCEIIERRAIQRLIAQSDNERAIRDIDEVSSESLDALKNGGAEIVVFGDVFDDVESGEIIVTVTYQGLGGKKHKIRSGTIGRGQKNDRSKRMDLVSQLVPKGFSDASRGGAASKRKELRRKMINDIIVDINSCERDAHRITCHLEITNNDADRDIAYVCSRSVFYDDSGNQFNCTNTSLANKSGNSVISLLAISGIPLAASISIENVSIRSKTISRAEITVGTAEIWNKYVFKNIPIDDE